MFYKGELPFIRLLIPLIAGILAGFYFAHPFILHWRLLLSLLIPFLFFLLLILYKRMALYRSGWIFGLFIHAYLLITAYGLTVYVSGRFDEAHYSSSRSEALFIKVNNEPKLSNGILRLEARVFSTYFHNKIQIRRGKLLLAIKDDSSGPFQPNYGDMLLIPAVYNVIDPPFNPGEFDYRTYLEDRQIYFQSFINRDQFIILKRNAGNPVISFALTLRKGLVEKFNTYLPGKEAAALASTLVLGYRADLDQELIRAYSKTGTMHVLSVSGMHVGIVFLVLSVLLKPMARNRQLILFRALLIISIIWFYSLLTGFSAPVCRAALMLSFVVLGKALNKNQNTFNLIAISAFFLLLYDPFFLFDVGFQLSYLAVCGLVYFHPKIYHVFYFKNKVLDHTWNYCALSIAAQLATFPLSLYYFHQFPVYFLLSNLLIVLPVTIIMYAGILFLLLPFSVALKPLGLFLNWIINLNNTVLYRIENLPFSALSGIWIDSFQYLLICSLIGSFMLWISFRSKGILWAASFFALILTASFSVKNILNYKRHELIFFSLRKNTAIAYLYRGRSIIISDLEPLDKLLAYSVKPALESRGDPEYLFFGAGEHFSGKSYWSKGDFLQFGDFRILRWTKDFNGFSITGNLKVDAILLNGGPDDKLQDIRSFVNFNRVLIDGTNPDHKIQAWRSEAGKLNIPCHVLKKYPAYVVKL